MTLSTVPTNFLEHCEGMEAVSENACKRLQHHAFSNDLAIFDNRESCEGCQSLLNKVATFENVVFK